MQKIFSYKWIFVFLLLLTSCASMKTQQGTGTTGLKNSLPLFERELLENVGSIAVLPFYGDRHNWKNTAYNVILSKAKVQVISNEKIERAIKESRKNISNLKPSDRVEILSRIGRSLQSDTVLNGVILATENHSEIILQLISSSDGRVLWWQAVDLQLDDNQAAPSEQIFILKKMLEPVFMYLGKRIKSKIMDKGTDKDKDSIDVSPM